MSRNDITGDKIKSRVSNKEYEDNFDKIFRNKSSTNKPTQSDEWDEGRLDVIGQNGNDGIHYASPDQAYQQVEKHERKFRND